MTCKDCLYYPKCHSVISYGMDIDDTTGELTTDIDKKCKDFKEKFLIVELPCNVGDTVYFINRFFTNAPRINEFTVDALHITSGKNRLGHKKPSHALVRDKNMHSLSSRIYFEDFGITAFLSREEAEKAIAERTESL